MPAAVVKGILLSLGVLAALGFAAYENPEIQAWIDEQRRKIAELLRSIGSELDPESRREAEAFAFEGRTPQQPQETPRSSPPEPNAEAVLATGRDDERETVRRAPLQMMRDAHEAEERQRLGEEYLAQRNKQMQEMKERRQNTTRSVISEGPSFESIVDAEGNLRSAEKQPMKEIIGVPTPFEQAMSNMISNPFSDDHELERSSTPRPPVPPKIRLENVEPTQVGEDAATTTTTSSQLPGAFPSQDAHEDLTYEEQLALAISLSEQEARTQPPPQQSYDMAASTDETELRHAIEASLRDNTRHQLVDVSEPSYTEASEEDLYNATPHLTKAKLVDLNAQLAPLLPMARAMPFDPVRDAARSSNQPDEAAAAAAAASFYSAHDGSFVNSSLPSLHHASWLRPVRDNDTETLRSGTRTPTEASVVSYPSDEEAGDRAATHPDAITRNASHSSMELIDVEDVDMDVISEDGIATPDSWTEVGSHDGDSEHEMQLTAA